jgi:hypothetical protein
MKSPIAECALLLLCALVRRRAARYRRRGITSLSAVELQNVLIGPNEPSVLRCRRLWPLLLTRKQVRKTSPGDRGHRGEAPTCIYRRAAQLERLGSCWRPFSTLSLNEPTSFISLRLYKTAHLESAGKLKLSGKPW